MSLDDLEILLIEDNPQDAELAMDAFKSHNLANKIVIIDDGEKAIDYLFGKEQKMKRLPRLILLDLKLPKVDGLEILKRLKSDKRMKVVPVVIMTSSKEESDIVKSYELGVNSYLVKPVDFEKFVQSVVELGLYWIVSNKVPF